MSNWCDTVSHRTRKAGLRSKIDPGPSALKARGPGPALPPQARGPAPLPRRRRVLRQLVADDLAAFHHELDALKLGDVRQRIARHRDDVRVLAFLDRADLVLPPQYLGVDDGGGLDRPHGTHMGLLDERL